MSKRLGSNWGVFGSGIEEEMGIRNRDMSRMGIVKLKTENVDIFSGGFDEFRCRLVFTLQLGLGFNGIWRKRR